MTAAHITGCLHAILAALALAAAAQGTAAVSTDPLPAAGTSAHLVFDQYSPIATSSEIVRRTSSPIAADRVLAYLHDHPQRLPEQTIDLKQDRFWLYVPKGEPPKDGYGLLVFIAPWDDGTVPSEWRAVLDKHGLIYVAADRSGNDEDMLLRRIPLALHAYANVATRYRLDPARIYVSGFSGGSRTAMRTALTYPDVFRGAVLNSGSDPFGVEGISVPPANLFRLFQERSRIMLVSGTEDLEIDARDANMLDAAERLCVQGVDTQPMLHAGHALMRAAMLDHALSAIEHAQTDTSHRLEALARCRAGVEAEIARDLDNVRALLAQGKKQDAGHALSRLDERFGGLAAPASVELARQILSR